jgi:hypothetical protein
MDFVYCLPDEIVFLDYPGLDLGENDNQIFGLMPETHLEHPLEHFLQLGADKFKTREVFGLDLQPVHQKSGNRFEEFDAFFFLRNLFSKDGEDEYGPFPLCPVGTAGAQPDLFQDLDGVPFMAFLEEREEVFDQFVYEFSILQDSEAVAFQVNDSPLESKQHPFILSAVEKVVGTGDDLALFLPVDIHINTTSYVDELFQSVPAIHAVTADDCRCWRNVIAGEAFVDVVFQVDGLNFADMYLFCLADPFLDRR